MKIHIATSRDLRGRACRLARRLRRAGHRVVSRWIDGGGKGATAADNALYTMTDITLADCLLLLGQGRRKRRARTSVSDRHAELGYALRAGKRVCVLGPSETMFARLRTVDRYETVKELIDGLR